MYKCEIKQTNEKFINYTIKKFFYDPSHGDIHKSVVYGHKLRFNDTFSP